MTRETRAYLGSDGIMMRETRCRGIVNIVDDCQIQLAHPVEQATATLLGPDGLYCALDLQIDSADSRNITIRVPLPVSNGHLTVLVHHQEG